MEKNKPLYPKDIREDLLKNANKKILHRVFVEGRARKIAYISKGQYLMQYNTYEGTENEVLKNICVKADIHKFAVFSNSYSDGKGILPIVEGGPIEGGCFITELF